MAECYDDTDLAREADARIQKFQKEASKEAAVFHHLITLPTYHTAALSSDQLAKNYFSNMGMLAYVQGVQRIEIRNKVACVKHQVCFIFFFKEEPDTKIKGRLRVTIFKSADIANLMASVKYHNNISCTVSADVANLVCVV